MNNSPLDSEFITPPKRRPLWQRLFILVIGLVILIFGILIILNLIDIFQVLTHQSQMLRA
jgi:hypothetical protein